MLPIARHLSLTKIFKIKQVKNNTFDLMLAFGISYVDIQIT